MTIYNQTLYVTLVSGGLSLAGTLPTSVFLLCFHPNVRSCSHSLIRWTSLDVWLPRAGWQPPRDQGIGSRSRAGAETIIQNPELSSGVLVLQAWWAGASCGRRSPF